MSLGWVTGGKPGDLGKTSICCLVCEDQTSFLYDKEGYLSFYVTYIFYFSILEEQLCPIEIGPPFFIYVSHICNLEFSNSHIKKHKKKGKNNLNVYF